MRSIFENAIKPSWAVGASDAHRPDGRGVYFLWAGDELAYIGSSENLKLRIDNHASSRTCDFTAFSWVTFNDINEKRGGFAVDAEYLLAIENLWIDRYRPFGNKQVDIGAIDKLNFAIHQVETGKYDGWHFRKCPYGLLEHWSEQFPEYHHRVVVWGEAPRYLHEAIQINRSEEYRKKISPTSPEIAAAFKEKATQFLLASALGEKWYSQ